jgi:hypothetical protein
MRRGGGELRREPGGNIALGADGIGHDLRIIAASRFVIEHGIALFEPEKADHFGRFSIGIELEIGFGPARGGQPVGCRGQDGRSKECRDQNRLFHRKTPHHVLMMRETAPRAATAQPALSKFLAASSKPRQRKRAAPCGTAPSFRLDPGSSPG